MRILIVACRVMTRELSYYAAISPHTVELTWMPQGLHNEPGRLRTGVQGALDAVFENLDNGVVEHRPDAICLGYGLCSNGVVGLESRDVPLVVPRTDDCIALFLGSQQRYLSLFEADSGVYWLNPGWIESAYTTPDYWRNQEAILLERYTEAYGEDNAEFLVEQETAWKRQYHACTYIHPTIHSNPAHEETARALTVQNGWTFQAVQGDDRMLRMMAFGEWNDTEFLICPPYHRIEAAFDGSKLCAVKR